MQPDQCRLEFVDLQETVLPDTKIRADFDICTWKVRVIRLFNVRQSFMVQSYLVGRFWEQIVLKTSALVERRPTTVYQQGMFDQLFSSAGWHTTVSLIFCWNIGYNSFKCFSEKVPLTVVVTIQAYQTFLSSRLFSLGKGNIELNRKRWLLSIMAHEIMGGPEVPSSGFRFIHVWKGRKENSRVGKMTIIL